MDLFNKKLRVGIFTGALLLAGCGGGGGDEGTPTPAPPPVTNESPTVSQTTIEDALEQEALTLSATASDSDGSIASYSWSHDASFEFTSSGLSTAEATFTSPDITEDVTVNFTVTVTDDDGATASSTQEVLIKRKVSNVTITGIVTDEPIANAELEIVVGSESFNVQAGDNGRYTAVLDIDESSAKKLVRVKAKGLDTLNPGVEFVSQLSSVEKLLAQAGDDKTLDSNDNFGVNITNVTTAEFALLTRGGTEPESEEELDSALLNVDADEKIQLATLIKIVVDNPDYSLPEGVNSTLELVANEQVAKQFEEEVTEKDPEIIEKTKKEIKEDDDLVTGATGSLEGNYIINSPRYHTNTAFHLSLMADGSGQFSSNTSSAITWSESAGVYTLEFDKQVTIYQNSDAESSESLVLTGLSFIVLAENDVFRTIEITRSTERMIVDRNSGSVTMTTEEDETYTTNLIYKNKTISLLAEQLIGEWAFHAYENDYDTSDEPDLPETLQFYADGTGDVGGNSSEAFTWQLNSHSLTVNYDEDGETGQLELWFTKALSGGYQLVGLDRSFDEPSDTLTGLLIKKQAVTTTNEDLVGRWHGFIGTSQSYDLNIHSDGTTMIGLGITDWQGHLEDGQFTRKRFIYNNEVVTSCEGFDTSCYLNSEMIHEFISIVDNLFYINRTINYYLPNGEISSKDGAILVYEYSKDLTYSALTEELLENYTEFYSADGQTDRVYAEYDESGNVTYAVEVEGQTYFGATFNDGVLSYDRNGEKWHFELVSSDTDSIVVCHYKDGGTCNAASQITYLPKRPKVTLTANSNGNGEISPASQESFLYQKVGFEIIPDDDFVLDSIEGCEGYIEGSHYIAFAGNMDCEINATFKEQEETVGKFIIGNQDLYYASAYTIELKDDQTGTLTYNDKVDVVWTENSEGVLEITPQQEFILNEFQNIEYQEGSPVEVAYKNIATSLRLIPRQVKGSNWYELEQTIEQYKNDVFVEQSESSYEVNKTSLDQRLAIMADDIAGDWSVDLVSERTVYNVTFNPDGTGTSHDISDLSVENFTWQVLNNSIVLDLTGSDTETLFVTKDLNVGYQVVTQGMFEDEQYTDAGIMVRRNEQAISADNFAGRHQFRDGHDIDSHWAEMQIYQDGEVFFTTGTSSYQKGFEDGHLIRDLYYDTTDGNWQKVDSCDISSPDCRLYGEFKYTLVAIDGERYYVERTTHFYDDNQVTDSTSHLYIHDYSPSTKVDKLNEYDLDYISLYQNDSNGIARWFVTYGDYDEAQDKQHYTFQIDDAEPVNVELIDGKLELILDGQDTVIELIDNNRRDITFCKYLKGNSCQVGDEVYLSFDAPEHTITVNSDGNGSLAVGDESIVEHGSNWSTSIEPNSGYVLDSISGCDGYEDGSDYRIPYVKESCQIDVTFKEFVPLSTQANITDPALAMCVDNSGETSLESVIELNCRWNNYGEITSLAGLESLPNLQVLSLEYLNIGTHLDLSALEQLTEFVIGYSTNSEQQKQVETVQFYDSSLITRLELINQNISDIDLSAYTSLQYLSLHNNPLTQIDLSNQIQLVDLDLQSTELNQLDLTFNTQLESLWLNSGSLTELNIGHLTELRDAFLWGQTGVIELDVTNLTKLTRLDIGNMGVASLNLTNLVNLQDLGIAYTSINNLDFSALQSLSSLNVEGVEQSFVPWSQVYHISDLAIGGANYTSFDFSPFTSLARLQMSQSGISDLSSIANPELILSLDLFNNYQLEQLNISEMTSLYWLQVNNSPITTLDFSNNSNLTNVYFRQNALETISGIEAITDKSARLDFDNNPLSTGTVSYLDDLRDNQGYYNISYSVSYSVTVNVVGNGTASESSFTLSDGASRGIYLYPDSGYEVASVTGCDGTWDPTDYYEVGPITESCEVNVEFVETTP